MKRILFPLLFPVMLYAQEQSADSIAAIQPIDSVSMSKPVALNVIRLDLAGIILQPAFAGTYMIKAGYERTIRQNFSVGISVEQGQYDSQCNAEGIEIFNEKAFGIMPEVRFFPFIKRGSAPVGFFLDAHARYYFLNQNYLSYNFVSKGYVTNMGLNIGYKTMGNHFAAEILIGYGMSSGSWRNADERSAIPFNDRKNDLNSFGRLRAELSICYIFPGRL